MTYRFGRTGRKRHAAMVSGMPAYVAGPTAVRCADGYHLGTDGKCHKNDPDDPLDPGLPIRPAKKKKATSSKPKRAGKKRRYGKVRRMKKRRLSAKTVTRGKCDDLYDGSKPFGGKDYQDCVIKSTR
jgi:hypothetical protein